MVGGNYPPGTSRRDLIRAGIIEEPNSHEHEWGMHDDHHDDPILEDGAFIFHEQCQYSKGGHGQWGCEETRSYEFHYARLIGKDGETIELPTISGWEDIDESVQRIIEEIEVAFHDDPGDVVEWDIDPDPDDGQVVLYHNGWKLVYEP